MAVNNKKPAYLYCITNTVNGKKYIGKTNNPDKREIRSHVKMGVAFVGQVLRNHGISKL